MSRELTTLEIIAPTPEEAIARGLADLSLSREAVDIEVLDTGSRGLLGIGGRQARVRLTVKQAKPSEIPAANAPKVSEESLEVTLEKAVEVLDEEEAFQVDTAVTVVSELLDRMSIKAKVAGKMLAPVDEKDEKTVKIDITGNDLTILVAKHAEILNALQYIASLIISREVGHWVPLLVDVQGFRSRRERALRTMARRVAEQVISTGRKEVLEPMPANERRIIHLELRDHPQVETESVGDEPNRKVTIKLKSQIN
jgi:spoIIIJ-associated protein